MLSGQRRVDPRNMYDRLICVVPMVGSGTAEDPKRPKYAPWPISNDPNAIIAFVYEPSDDGNSAIAEFVGRTRFPFQAILADRSITAFELGVASKADIESGVKPFRKDFDLDKFGMAGGHR